MDISRDGHASPEDRTEALHRLDRVIDKLRTVPAGTLLADAGLAEHWAQSWFDKIDLLYASARYREMAEAARAFQENWAAHAPGQAHSDPVCWHWLGRAGCEEARALMAQAEEEAALAVAQGVQRNFETAQALPIRHAVARAGRLEIHLRAHMGATFARVDMVRRCDELLQRFQGDDYPDTRIEVARIRWAKAQMLEQLEYSQDALNAYDAIWRDCAASALPEIGEIAADARLQQSQSLHGLGRADEAEACRLDVIRQFGDSAHAGTRASVALARLRESEWLERDERMDPEERDARTLQAYDALIKHHDAPRTDSERRFVNIAWRRRSELMRASDEPDAEERAAAWAREQWRRWSEDPDESVQAQVLEAMVDDLYASEDASPERLAHVEEVLARLGGSETASLQRWLARLQLGRADLLRDLDRNRDALDVVVALENRWRAAPQADARQQAAFARIRRFQLLRETGAEDEALALAQAAPPPTPTDAEPDPAGLRYARANLLVEALDLWRRRLPAPLKQEEEAAPVTDAACSPIEAAQMPLLDGLLAEFSADRSVNVRRKVIDAGYLFAIQQREQGRPGAAVETYARLETAFDADTDPEVQRRLASARLNHGYALMILLHRPEAALPVYDALVARHAQATDPALRDTLAKAAASRLTCLNRLQSQGVAVNYGDQYEDLPLEKRKAIQATIERGRTASQAGRHREAVACYDEVLDAHIESLHPELRRLCLDALVRKGYTLAQAGDRPASLAANNEAITRYGADLSTEMEKDIALATTNKIIDLCRLERIDEALATCEVAIERWRDSGLGYLRGRAASAWFSKAYELARRDRATAEQPYRTLFEYGVHDTEPAVQLQAFKAAVNLNLLLRELGRAHDAVAVSMDALRENNPQSTDPAMQEQRAKLLQGLARSHALTGDKQAQLACYDELLQSPSAWIDAARRSGFQQERNQLAVQMRLGRLGGFLKGLKAKLGK